MTPNLKQFWSSVWWKSYNVYLSGEVPDTAKLPYLTYEYNVPSSFGGTVLTAIYWTDNLNDRIGFMDAARHAIPTEGVRIQTADGLINLFPNESTFLSFYDDPSDPSIKGARVSYEAYFYEK